MSMRGSKSRLATAAVALGILSVLMVAAGTIWASTTKGEAILGPMALMPLPTALVALAGAVVALIALVRRARPNWMAILGLLFSSIALTIALIVLVQVLMLIASFNSMYELQLTHGNARPWP